MTVPCVEEFSCGQAFDLGTFESLQPGWAQQTSLMARHLAEPTKLTGQSTTSIRDWNVGEVELGVVTGDVVRRELPWLFGLYSGPLKELAEEFAGRPIKCSTSEISDININVLSGVGASYEWHVDSNPVTGLLFVTSHAAGEGGELAFG